MIKPDIPIHVWGGLGSQLYGLALGLYLKNRYKLFDFHFVFHSSGVTRRIPQFETEFLFGMKKISIDDFQNSKKVKGIKNLSVPNGRKIIKLFLNNSSISISCNSDFEVKKLRFWTREIRGHYSNRTIDSEVVRVIYSSLYSNIRNDHFSNLDLAVHFRLGDLVNLDSKEPINASKVVEQIRLVIDKFQITQIAIFSDSPELAKDLILGTVNFEPSVNFIFPELEISETMVALTSSKIFLATPSKISEWALLFRNSEYPNCLNFVPTSFSNFVSRHSIPSEIVY